MTESQKVFAVLGAEIATQYQLYQDAAQTYALLFAEDKELFAERTSEIALLAGQADLAQEAIEYLPKDQDKETRKRLLLTYLLAGALDRFAENLEEQKDFDLAPVTPWILNQFEVLWRKKTSPPSIDHAKKMIAYFPDAPEPYGWLFKAAREAGQKQIEDHTKELITQRWPTWYLEDECPKIQIAKGNIENQLSRIGDTCRYFYIQQMAKQQTQPKELMALYAWSSTTYDKDQLTFKYNSGFPLNYFWANYLDWTFDAIKYHQFNQARGHFIELTQHNESFKDKLLEMYLKRIDEAKWPLEQKIQSLNLIHKSFPSWDAPEFYIGMQWVDQQQLERAIPIFRSVIKKNPDHALALNALAYSLAEKKQDLDEAKHFIERALKIHHQPMFLDTIGWVYYQLGSYTQALEWIKKAYILTPNDPEIKAHYQEILKKISSQKNIKRYSGKKESIRSRSPR
jgi:tetratricopeptide (TPR) repeat protein